MADSNIGNLSSSATPLLGTDLTVVSRDGVVLSKAQLSELPVSSATQSAIDAIVAQKGVANGIAPLDSGGKVASAYLPSFGKSAITSSRVSTTGDDGTTLSNTGSTAYTLTINSATIPNGLVLQQLSTGTVTVAAGAGVTLIGATLVTSGAGGVISVLPTATADTFIVKVA